MAQPCPEWKTCRAMQLTTWEFMRLGGEHWSHSFRIKVGQEAKKLHKEIFSQPPGKHRVKRNHSNTVGVYPCGILEQAYRTVRAREESRSVPASD